MLVVPLWIFCEREFLRPIFLQEERDFEKFKQKNVLIEHTKCKSVITNRLLSLSLSDLISFGTNFCLIKMYNFNQFLRLAFKYRFCAFFRYSANHRCKTALNESGLNRMRLDRNYDSGNLKIESERWMLFRPVYSSRSFTCCKLVRCSDEWKMIAFWTSLIRLDLLFMRFGNEPRTNQIARKDSTLWGEATKQRSPLDDRIAVLSACLECNFMKIHCPAGLAFWTANRNWQLTTLDLQLLDHSFVRPFELPVKYEEDQPRQAKTKN